MSFAITYFLIFYMNIGLLLIFICYGRILLTIRRQASVMAGHSGPGPSSAQVQTSKMQSSIIKTMMLVSGLFAISQAPTTFYSLVFYSRPILEPNEIALYTAMFLAYV